MNFVYPVIFEFLGYFVSLDSKGSGKVSLGAAESVRFFF